MVENVRSNLHHLSSEVDAPALSPSEPSRSPELDTERVSPRYCDIDLWDSADILEALIEGQFVAVAAVRAARPALERASDAIEARLKGGGRLVYVGAGTSGRLAVQDGAELMPTFSWPADRLLLLIAGGSEALLRSVEGAEDEVEHAAQLVRSHDVGPADALIAVAASGSTPFTLSCLRAARRRGALTVGIANNPGTPLLEDADCPVLLETGSEPIAGSTRMKAGTAQRIALNLLSSLVMIRLGRVYGGLMVDMQAANAKLTRRSQSMLRHLTGRSSEEISTALAAADGSVKLAALLLKGCDPADAKAVLNRAGGQLRIALAAVERRAPVRRTALARPGRRE
jgi:N-acetylmuramic acid 6-phosphate etherase